MTTSAFEFSPSQFLKDVKFTADLLDADFSDPVTQRVLDLYARSFREGGGAVANHGQAPWGAQLPLLREEADGYRRNGRPWRAAAGELCDFDTALGLVKTWVYLGGLRPVEEVLGVRGVPWSIRRHERRFRELGLVSVRHVAVDYQHDTATLYFRTGSGITPEECERLLSLTESGPPDTTVFDDMANFTVPDGYTFSVTMWIGTGDVERVVFYALRLPAGRFPRVGERLAAFFASAPSHDDDEMNAVAWSFGKENNYLKAERSYCGRLVSLMREWNSPMTDLPRKP